MGKNRVNSNQVTARELSILEDLYEKKAVTTAQIQRRYFRGTTRMVYLVIHRMKKRHLIVSNTAYGSRIGKRGYVYYRITEHGISVLRYNGYPVSLAKDIYLSPKELVYVLIANEAIIGLEDAGWTYINSRKTKRDYNLDAQMQIKGILGDPDGTKYGLYVLNQVSNGNTLGKIQAEIRDTHISVKNYIIYANGEESASDFIHMAFHPMPKQENGLSIPRKPLYTGYDLKVLTKGPSYNRLKVYPTLALWIKALSKCYGFEIINLYASPENHAFPIMIRYQDREMYLADLTGSDLNTVWKLNYYDQHERMKNQNRDVIVFYYTERQLNMVSNVSDYLLRAKISKETIIGLGLTDGSEKSEPVTEG